NATRTAPGVSNPLPPRPRPCAAGRSRAAACANAAAPGPAAAPPAPAVASTWLPHSRLPTNPPVCYCHALVPCPLHGATGRPVPLPPPAPGPRRGTIPRPLASFRRPGRKEGRGGRAILPLFSLAPLAPDSFLVLLPFPACFRPLFGLSRPSNQ